MQLNKTVKPNSKCVPDLNSIAKKSETEEEKRTLTLGARSNSDRMHGLIQTNATPLSAPGVSRGIAGRNKLPSTYPYTYLLHLWFGNRNNISVQCFTASVNNVQQFGSF